MSEQENSMIIRDYLYASEQVRRMLKSIEASRWREDAYRAGQAEEMVRGLASTLIGSEEVAALNPSSDYLGDAGGASDAVRG